MGYILSVRRGPVGRIHHEKTYPCPECGQKMVKDQLIDEETAKAISTKIRDLQKTGNAQVEPWCGVYVGWIAHVDFDYNHPDRAPEVA